MPVSEAPAGWARALAYALTGQDLPLPQGGDSPDPSGLAAALAAAGWDRSALRAHADRVRSDGRPWPHAVPSALLTGLPAAQFTAALRALVADWGLVATVPRVRSRTPSLARPGDDRLLRDLPPHFGKL